MNTTGGEDQLSAAVGLSEGVVQIEIEHFYFCAIQPFIDQIFCVKVEDCFEIDRQGNKY